jgi:Ca2+-binding EF-hand superfamily protein
MSRSQVKAPPPAPTKASRSKDRLTEEGYNQLRDSFKVFDEDGSGSIDPTEINKALEELGLDKRNSFILSLIHALRDKNKSITFEEFIEIVGSRVGDNKNQRRLEENFCSL